MCLVLAVLGWAWPSSGLEEQLPQSPLDSDGEGLEHRWQLQGLTVGHTSPLWYSWEERANGRMNGTSLWYAQSCWDLGTEHLAKLWGRANPSLKVGRGAEATQMMSSRSVVRTAWFPWREACTWAGFPERRLANWLPCLLTRVSSVLGRPSVRAVLQSCMLKHKNSLSESRPKYFSRPPNDPKSSTDKYFESLNLSKEICVLLRRKELFPQSSLRPCLVGGSFPLYMKSRGICPASLPRLLPACCDSNDSARSSQVSSDQHTMVQWLESIF